MERRKLGLASEEAAKDLALVAPRAALAATMLHHGREKLRRETREQTARSFEELGFRPGGFWSRATGWAEACAGVLTLAGILTRPAALAVLVTQGFAIAKVHRKHGFPVTKGGFEFNLALMAIAAGLLAAGPGRFSLHGVTRRAWPRRRGLFGGLFARGRARRSQRLLA